MRGNIAAGIAWSAALASLIAFVAPGGAASGAELSLVSGLYKHEETKADKTDLGGTRTIGGGARYADQMDSRMFWFAQGALTLRSYEKGDLPEKPSDSTSLALGGGVRYYFNKLSESLSPFAYGIGEFRNDKEATFGSGGYTETEDNGLFYGGAAGLRLSLDTDFFVDLETPLFSSALFATRKEETYSAANDSTSKVERKRTELWAESTGPFTGMQVALGMRL